MRRFRKKPVEVTAVQWTGSNEDEVRALAGEHFHAVDPEDRGDDPDQTAALLDEHSSWVEVYDGHWIVKDAKGHLLAVADDVFAETYEPVHGPEITGHPAYAQWFATGERIRAELGATNANRASWIPHPFAGEGLPVCAACEQPEGSQIHWHDCAESGCGTARGVDA